MDAVVVEIWQPGQLWVGQSEDGETGGHEDAAGHLAASRASLFGGGTQHLGDVGRLVDKRRR